MLQKQGFFSTLFLYRTQVNLYNAGVRGEVETELECAIPTLVKVGLFDLFSVEEWINGNNLGRRFVGEKAKEFLANR